MTYCVNGTELMTEIIRKIVPPGGNSRTFFDDIPAHMELEQSIEHFCSLEVEKSW